MIALAVALLVVAADPCAYDRAAMLAMPPQAFDQTVGSGWRPLAEVPGCRLAAADLIAMWRSVHWATLRPSQAHGSYWHEAQLRAAAGQTPRAVRLFLAGVEPDNPDDREDYALGTVAFLQHDIAALKAARARLAAQPEPAWFQEAAKEARAHGMAPTWPAGLEELDSFIACFNRPYAEAYHGACSAKAARER